VRKVVSVVFGDIVGSTALQETLDAESVRGVMARFYEAMRAVVARHDGHLEKFLGDGVVAVFGIPSVGEDDALRAVRCAAAMHDDLVELDAELCRLWGVRLRMRVGVATGELVTSGDGELVGDAMNTAARLEQSAPPGEVLIGESTWRLVRHSVQLETVSPLALRGKSAPVRAWRLLDTAPAPGDPASGRLDTPFRAELRARPAARGAARRGRGPGVPDGHGDRLARGGKDPPGRGVLRACRAGDLCGPEQVRAHRPRDHFPSGGRDVPCAGWDR
jgi:class 3 adenylate cyclase